MQNCRKINLTSLDFHLDNFYWDVESSHCSKSILCSMWYQCNLGNNLHHQKSMKKKFKCRVGYSDHTMGTEVSVAAVALGATALERHITIDRTLWGSDQSASLGPDGMRQLVQLVRKISTQIGDGNKKFIRLEKKKLSTMQYWK